MRWLPRDTLKLHNPRPGRVETGPVRFDDDWPGVFIRGDQALHFGCTLNAVLGSAGLIDPIYQAVLRGLQETLMSCECKEETNESAD